MLGLTHLLFGLFIGTGFSYFFGHDPAFLAFAALGSLMPDIDHPQSILGRHVKPIGWFARHRGFLHSLIGGVAFTIVLDLFLRTLNQTHLYSFAFLAGFLSHLLLDGSTKGGVQALWPAKMKLKGKRKVGSLLETVFQIVLVAILILFWT